MSPLSGKRIVVTRPRAQASALCDRLAAVGAVPIPCPTIEIAPLEDYTAFDNAIRQIGSYHWIIFTSANGVAAFWNRLDLAGVGDPRGLITKFAAIGPATARALQARGAPVTFIPDEYVAERILDGLGDVNGCWVLLPRADIAREALAVELANRGALVHEIAAYRTLPARLDPQALAELQRGVDAILFTSSSTVRNFVKLSGHIADVLARATIACIGPVTAQTARDVGLRVDVVADTYTMDGLVTALADHLARSGAS